MYARILVMAAALAALALAPAALAKGPTQATLFGPGVGTPLQWKSVGDPSGGTAFGQIVQNAGFFQATFGQTPDPMLDERPAGNLGPRYTITYVVPGPSGSNATIRQDVYPYAEPAPVTYMKPRQRFFDNEHTRGGWFIAPASLKQTLVAEGLPANPPSGGGSDGWSPLEGPWPILGGAALALVLLGGLTLALRRRTPAAAVH